MLVLVPKPNPSVIYFDVYPDDTMKLADFRKWRGTFSPMEEQFTCQSTPFV